VWILPHVLNRVHHVREAMSLVANVTYRGGYVFLTASAVPLLGGAKLTPPHAHGPFVLAHTLDSVITAMTEAGFTVVEALGWGNREHAHWMLIERVLPTMALQMDYNTYADTYTTMAVLGRKV
jgi:hypothetical protein